MLWNSSLTVTNTTYETSCDHFIEKTFWILNISTGGLTFFGNLLVFMAIITHPGLRELPMNQFLASLAVTDIIMGVFVSSGYSLFCIGCLEYPMSRFCWLMESPRDIAFASSICNLAAISYDRYLAVYSPLRYASLMSRHRVILIVSLTWVLSFIIAGMRHFWIHTKTEEEIGAINNVYQICLISIVFLIPCIIITVINIKIILTIRKQARQVATRGQSFAQNSTRAGGQDENQTEIAPARRNWKGTFACAVVVVVFVLCWIPRISFNVEARIKGGFGEVSLLKQKLSIFFLTLQSSVNPLIYSFYRADFRKAAWKLLRCKN